MGSDEIKAGTTGTACQSFKTITWSTRDTRQTQDQITEHNGVYTALCGGDTKGLQ